MKTGRTYLENKLKTLETSANFIDYPDNNQQLDKIYQEKADGIRSKCDWQDHDEKFLRYFLDLEKSRAGQN